MDRERYFRYFNDKTKSFEGRFTGKTPGQAAIKCARRIFENHKSNGQNLNTFEFRIKEVTRPSKKKIFCYRANVIKFVPPIQVQMGQKIISFKRKITVDRIFSKNIINKSDIINEPVMLVEPTIHKITSKTLLVIEI